MEESLPEYQEGELINVVSLFDLGGVWPKPGQELAESNSHAGKELLAPLLLEPICQQKDPEQSIWIISYDMIQQKES